MNLQVGGGVYIVCLVFFGDFNGCHSVGAMFRFFRDEVDSDTSVCCRGFRMVWVFGGQKRGGGGDSDTWPSCNFAVSAFQGMVGWGGGWGCKLGRAGGVDSDTWTSYRVLVSPLNVLPMIFAWCLQWSSEKGVPISPPYRQKGLGVQKVVWVERWFRHSFISKWPPKRPSC